jgi:hypothetical protein
MAPTVPLRCPWRWLLDANWTQISVVWAAPNKINETLATLSPGRFDPRNSSVRNMPEAF